MPEYKWDWDEKECENPAGLKACRFCGSHCYSTDWVNDYRGRGKVIRISCGCSQLPGYEKDDFRTACFAPEADAVAEWNEMMTT
jgi:hypothetical protein